MRIIKFSALLLLLSLGFNMPSAFAGAGIGNFWNINNRPVTATLSYFDLRDRETMVQVTNTSADVPATIHVQIFADAFSCADRDFFDSLTPNQTHVYDIRNLVRAIGSPVSFQIPDGSHGFVIISSGDGTDTQQLIISNFRIIDDSGYEYRVNSAGTNELSVDGDFDLVGRFTDNWGARLSDVVGVTAFFEGDADGGTRDYSVQVTAQHAVNMFDDEENPFSCAQVQFGCDERPGDNDFPFADGDEPEFRSDFINQGINEVFTNSRGGGILCEGGFNTDGYISLTPPSDGFGFDFVGYIGLNDGAGRGSMDRFRVTNLITP